MLMILLFFSDDKNYLENILSKIDCFLREKLHLSLHPDKVSVETFGAGVDFLGWTHFPHCRTIRVTTKRKILKNLKWCPRMETVNSYRGLLGHGDTYEIRKKLNIAFF